MAAATSYRLLLPPGWRQLPLDDTAEQVVDGLLAEQFAALPRDSVTPYRLEVRKMLLSQVAAAREARALDLYLPFEAQRGRPAAASFVVAHVAADPEGPGGGEDVAGLLAALVQEQGSAPVQVGDRPAVRTEVVVAPEPGDREGPLSRSSRRVTYQVAVPGGGWLLVSFSTLVLEERDHPTAPGRPDGPRFDDVLVDLFDAIVSTLRWKVETAE